MKIHQIIFAMKNFIIQKDDMQTRLCVNFFHFEDCGKILVRGVKEKSDIKSTDALKEAFTLGASI